jgi:hypothetical protein
MKGAGIPSGFCQLQASLQIEVFDGVTPTQVGLDGDLWLYAKVKQYSKYTITCVAENVTIH